MPLDHSFKRQKPVFKKFRPDDAYKFKPLPNPPGNYPYRLKLDQVIPLLKDQDKMVFHMVGDTGSVRLPEFQHLVAGQMARQVREAASLPDRPLFLFHLGDLVYKYGEAEGYYRQFFKPYGEYPCPVFAIAGNHDSDINPESAAPYETLDAFKAVFCDTVRRKNPLAEDTGRDTMIQPNIYWTLQTPLANFIGLYTNVPKYGVVTDEQRSWFISELRSAGKEKADKALIVCLHHAPYSADINHSSSLPMIQMLDYAFEKAETLPDIVFSGHVHNYQRFGRVYPGGKRVPFIVAGAGGYDELHPIASQDDPGYSDHDKLFDTVTLDNYCSDKHGFLKITIEKMEDGLTLGGEYYTIPHTLAENHSFSATIFDQFEIKLAEGRR
jgi:hypothetical protein